MSDLLSTNAAAKLLGVGTTTIKRWADEALLPCVRTAGGHRRFRRSDVLAMQGGTATPATQAPLHERLPAMTEAELDALREGVIQVDDHGRVLSYNRAESAFSGLSPEAVIGRHFFGDVAPCTNNGLVFGAFKAGVASGELDERLSYTFTFRMRPTHVTLHLYRHAASATNWIIVRQITGATDEAFRR